MTARDDSELFSGFRDDLIFVHDELRGLTDAARGALAPGVAVDADALRPTLEGLLDRLDRHHRAEDVFFFPAFRAAGRLSSADAEFLDECDSEHHDILGLSAAVSRDIEADPESATDLARWARRLAGHLGELDGLLRAHFAVEEAGLTVELVAHALRPDEMRLVYADMDANWRTR